VKRAALCVLTTLWALLAAPLLARAGDGPGDAPPGIDKDFWKLLVEVDARGANVNDLTATFRQEKFTPLMTRPLISTGTIKIKGPTALWETATPAPTIMRIDPGELRMYYPQQKVVEVYAIDKKMGPLAASPFPRLALIKPHFTFARFPAKELSPGIDEAKFVGVRMKPTDEDLRKHINEVDVLLEVATGLVMRAQTIDADDDRIVLTFADMKVNAGLTDRDLALNVPADVKVTRPLEGGASSPSDAAPTAGQGQAK